MRLDGPALALLLLALPLLGQQAPPASGPPTLRDADFELTFTPPAGMLPVAHDEAAQVFGSTPEQFNVTRPDPMPENAIFRHAYLWSDLTGRDRSARLLVEENPRGLPFTKAEIFKQFVETQVGLKVDSQEGLSVGQGYLVGMLAEGTRERSDGTVMRAMVAYFPSPPNTYAQVYFQALATDWDVMRPDFLESLKTLEMPQELSRTRPAAPKGESDLPTDYEEPWDTLQVTGSLALAAVLLLGLFLGGRGGA
ncbi:MAG: hypothetical protein H6825_12330 [Planctomycetes bacterium]|nr:hypothetical protein [Planctomycetota bacterium]